MTFRLEHESATLEKTLQAADSIEAWVGRVLEGERKPMNTLKVEDLALLVQFVRDQKGQP